MSEPKWLTDLQKATDTYIAEYAACILNGDPPPDPPCHHRYCTDLGYGLCMGVAGAQIDMLEESGRSRREAVGKVISDIWR